MSKNQFRSIVPDSRGTASLQSMLPLVRVPLVGRLLPNRWDLIAIPLILCLILMTSHGLNQTMAPVASLHAATMTLDPSSLPEYALRTILRMLLAMLASLLFTLIIGSLAAKSRRAEMVIIPVLDILQSVPVLGYLSFTVAFFMSLAPGKVIGVEMAAIFAIFTGQVWNMTFSFYQSLTTVPRDLVEVSRNMGLTAWQRFWKLEAPFAMPGLIWNMMMSMSGGWFFVVASEAISVGDHTVALPGIGSFLALAIASSNLQAVAWVILAMTLVILAYDQLLFRPMVAWADKFRMEDTSGAAHSRSWVLDMIRRTRTIQALLSPLAILLDRLVKMPLRLSGSVPRRSVSPAASKLMDEVWLVVVLLCTAFVCWQGIRFIAGDVSWDEVVNVFGLALLTMLRVLVLIILASLVWVPVGVYIGLRPNLAGKVQPLAQFLAAFPANLLFPVFVAGIVKFGANPDIWLTPLIVLGTQWYILFNVIAGASAFPNDYREVAANFGIRGWQWWRKVMLPGIFPYYITGAITASGGAWNASIVAELVQWGHTTLKAHGLGAYIAETTAAGDFPKITLGIAVMSLFVVLFNRLLWRPLYAWGENRLR